MVNKIMSFIGAFATFYLYFGHQYTMALVLLVAIYNVIKLESYKYDLLVFFYICFAHNMTVAICVGFLLAFAIYNLPSRKRGLNRCPTRLSKDIGILKSGTAVYIHNLTSNMQHNGRIGKIRWFDNNRDRYIVDVGLEAGPLALKVSNLQQLIQNVEITGIISQPEYNGQKGRIARVQNGLLVVQLAGGQKLQVKEEKLIVPNGTRVSLQNLSDTTYNDIKGNVVYYDRAAGRYHVQLRLLNKIVKVKREKCKLL